MNEIQKCLSRPPSRGKHRKIFFPRTQQNGVSRFRTDTMSITITALNHSTHAADFITSIKIYKYIYTKIELKNKLKFFSVLMICLLINPRRQMLKMKEKQSAQQLRGRTEKHGNLIWNIPSLSPICPT